MGGSAKRYGMEVEDLELEQRLRGMETALGNLSQTNQGVDAYSKARADSIASVVNLRVIGQTPGAVTVAWDPTSIPDLRRYQVVFAEDYSFSDNAQSFNSNTNSYQFNTASITGGAGGVVFYCRVRVENSIGTLSSWSDVLSVTMGQADGGDIADGAVGPGQLFDGSIGSLTQEELLQLIIDSEGLRGAMAGLTLSRASTTSISVSAGSTTRYTEQLESIFTKTNSLWAAGSGAGGLADPLVIAADEWYNVFLIKQDFTGAIDVGLDTDDEADNLLIYSGYDRYRLLGCVKTDASKEFIDFTQIKELFIWKDIVDEGFFPGSPPSTVARTEYALTVPLFKVEAIFNVAYNVNQDSAADVIRMEVSDLDTGALTPGDDTGRPNIAVGDNNADHADGAAEQFHVIVTTDQKIGIWASSTHFTDFEIGTVGWRHLGLRGAIVDDEF